MERIIMDIWVLIVGYLFILYSTICWAIIISQLIWNIIQWVDDVEEYNYFFKDIFKNEIENSTNFMGIVVFFWIVGLGVITYSIIIVPSLIIYGFLSLLRKLRRAQKILKLDLNKPVPPIKKE